MNQWSPRFADGMTPPRPVVVPDARDAETEETPEEAA